MSNTLDPVNPAISAPPDRARPRMAHDLTNPSDPLANKREKARERQRKKRERDRTGISAAQQQASAMQGLPLLHVQDPQVMLSPEESARKEKVRLAARERQRKHRAVVKARRMAELGLTIPTNPADPLGYRMNEDGEMEPVHDANAAAQAGPGGVPGAYPATPGQTFAHLLMTSATLNHNMKHHLLRTMQMTNEELNSFEPIIAAAWDHWNHQRMHYIQSQAQTNSDPDNADDGGGADGDMGYPSDQANEYRTRFHKSLAEPSPYQQMAAAAGHVHGASIDPSLAAQAVRETSSMRSQGVDGQNNGDKGQGVNGE